MSDDLEHLRLYSNQSAEPLLGDDSFEVAGKRLERHMAGLRKLEKQWMDELRLNADFVRLRGRRKP